MTSGRTTRSCRSIARWRTTWTSRTTTTARMAPCRCAAAVSGTWADIQKSVLRRLPGRGLRERWRTPTDPTPQAWACLPPTTWAGIRMSAAMTHLNPMRHRLNLTVRGNVYVRRVLVRGEQSRGSRGRKRRRDIHGGSRAGRPVFRSAAVSPVAHAFRRRAAGTTYVRSVSPSSTTAPASGRDSGTTSAST